MRKISLVACFLLHVCLFHFVLFPDTGYGKKPFLIKFATVAPEGSTWIKQMRGLDKTLREKSQGQLGFSLYPGGIAGDELDVLRKIRIGQIHSAAFSGVGLGQILPMVRVLDVPFLFRNDQEVDLVYKELRDFFSGHFRENGFEFLAWAEVGNVYLFSKKPIRRVADLPKLKVWTWSGDPISKETFASMGTNPIPLSITDVTTALNTGMIDTFFAPPLGALALQWHTHAQYMTALPLAHATGAVLISSSYFKRLPPSLARMLKDEFEIAMTELTSVLREQAEESVALIQKSGLEVIPVDAKSDLADFLMIHDRVAEKLAGKLYPKELLQRIYEILKRPR